MGNCGTQLRCTISFALIWLAARLWRGGAHLLPDDHPAKPFALGTHAIIRESRAAATYTPTADRVLFGPVVAWSGATLSWLTLLALEFAGVTSILWDGYLPGLPG